MLLLVAVVLVSRVAGFNLMKKDGQQFGALRFCMGQGPGACVSITLPICAPGELSDLHFHENRGFFVTGGGTGKSRPKL